VQSDFFLLSFVQNSDRVTVGNRNDFDWLREKGGRYGEQLVEFDSIRISAGIIDFPWQESVCKHNSDLSFFLIISVWRSEHFSEFDSGPGNNLADQCAALL
jgi:hypothetical protein